MRKILFVYLMVILASTLSPLYAQEGQTYYISTASARVRSCPRTNCEIVARLRSGTPVVIESVVEGGRVNGSNTWYEIEFNNSTGYVHASLTTDDAPTPVGGSSSSASSSPNSSQAPVGIRGGGGCPGLQFTCSQLTCDQARACLAAGGNDLDRDSDGYPCETQCGG